jgi:putative PIG3 family NAD(P)H quinone oxidoreductase
MTGMRAAVIVRPGGPEVLEIQERPIPTPGPNEILVRVRASALNRADLSQREGHYPAPPGAPPDIPGLEFAGEVVKSGAEASWKPGERVFGVVGGGGNAEYLVTDAGCVAAVPGGMSWTDAAAVPEAFITAHDALVVQASVRADEYVLIHAVGSGVGLAATQIARAFGATPFGTARTADKVDRARNFGLTKGIVIGDDPSIVGTAFNTATSGHGIDVTLDLVGGAYLGPSIQAAAKRGRIMCIGTVAGRTSTIPTNVVLYKRLTIRGTVLRARSVEEKRAATAAFARDLLPLFEAKRLVPVVDRVYDLGDIRSAHARLASNETFGKVVLRVS